MPKQNISSEKEAIEAALQQPIIVPIGAVTGDDEKRIFTAPYAADTPSGFRAKIDKVYLTNETTITADNTNYWTAQLSVVTPASVDLLSTAKNTTITSGTTITADTPWVLTPDQNATLAAGAVLELVLRKAASGTAFAELSATVLWHWEAV